MASLFASSRTRLILSIVFIVFLITFFWEGIPSAPSSSVDDVSYTHTGDTQLDKQLGKDKNQDKTKPKPNQDLNSPQLSNSNSNSNSHQTSNSKNPNKPNAVIFILLSPSRITQALVALQNVEDRFNRRLQYPIVLFTAESEVEYVTEEVRRKAEFITQGRARFATTTQESWDVPAWMDKARVQSSMDTIGFSFGYRAMCRYYSGFFWKNPAIASYDWLWRLDTDIQFHCDIPYDPIERMIEKKALYGFVQVNYDVSWVQPTLASNVSAFLSSHSHLLPSDANHHFVWRGDDGVRKALKGEGGNEEWSGACMYNNIEISHRSVWESDIYTKFFDYLEKAGGFFYERWGDSPVHSFGLAMSLRKDQVLQFDDFGYQHQGWAYGCPSLDRCACIKDGENGDFNDNAHAWFNPDH